MQKGSQIYLICDAIDAFCIAFYRILNFFFIGFLAKTFSNIRALVIISL